MCVSVGLCEYRDYGGTMGDQGGTREGGPQRGARGGTQPCKTQKSRGVKFNPNQNAKCVIHSLNPRE